MSERKRQEELWPEQVDENGSWVPEGNEWYRAARDLARQQLERPAFSYDPAADPFYQSAKSQYLRQGQRAMADAMGKAADLTGGFGSTYAQTAGQQAYREQLSSLSALLPELYDRARKGYDRRTEALAKALDTAIGLYDEDYRAYLKQVENARADREAAEKAAQWLLDFERDNDHWERDFARDNEHWDQDFARDNDQWERSFAEKIRQWEAEFAQSQQQWEDKQASSAASQAATEANRERSYAYKMAMLALQQGLQVSDALLQAAGIDRAYAETIRRYYAALHAKP